MHGSGRAEVTRLSLAFVELSVMVGDLVTKPENRLGLQESQEECCPFESMKGASLPKFPVTLWWGVKMPLG